MKTSRVTIHTLREMKQRGEKIAMLTCYDATFARLLDESHIDILLVGDSLGMVIQGHDTTLPVTLDEVVYHTRAVARGAARAHIVGDMPFMSYQAGVESALVNAGRLVKEGGAHAVKLEGGAQHAELVRRMTSAGIPVMGHLGLTPQSFHQFGGFKVQGRDPGAAERLVEDARTLEAAGAYAIVLEGIPTEVAAQVTSAIDIPTIGIGAGPVCDGQVLVIYDLLGMNDAFKPRFVRSYEKLATRIRTAADAYVADVRDGNFPGESESFSLVASRREPRASAPLAAVLHVGGCGPAATDDPPEPDAEPRTGGVVRTTTRGPRGES